MRMIIRKKIERGNTNNNKIRKIRREKNTKDNKIKKIGRAENANVNKIKKMEKKKRIMTERKQEESRIRMTIRK